MDALKRKMEIAAVAFFCTVTALIEAKQNGTQGVPGARQIVHDAEEIEKELDELAFELQEAERKLWLTGITAPSAR